MHGYGAAVDFAAVKNGLQQCVFFYGAYTLMDNREWRAVRYLQMAGPHFDLSKAETIRTFPDRRARKLVVCAVRAVPFQKFWRAFQSLSVKRFEQRNNRKKKQNGNMIFRDMYSLLQNCVFHLRVVDGGSVCLEFKKSIIFGIDSQAYVQKPSKDSEGGNFLYLNWRKKLISLVTV